MKFCRMCQEWKNETHFYKRGNRLQARCKTCDGSLGKYVKKDRTGEVHANLLGGPSGTYTPAVSVGRVGAEDHLNVKSLRFGKSVEQYVGGKLRSMRDDE